MASLLLRHRSACALGKGRQTAAGVEGCTCRPSFVGVLDTAPGGRVRLNATNLRDAQRELQRKIEQRTAGDDPARKTSFDKWAETFLADFTGRGSSRREYETTIAYAKPTVGRAATKDLRTITSEHVSGMLKRVREANERTVQDPNGTERTVHVSDATLSKHLRNLSAILEAAIGAGYLGRNPVKGLHKTQRPRAVEKKPSYFTDGELAKLWTVLPSAFPACTRTYVYKLAVSTGMRVGEIVALRWQDIDFVTGDIEVARSYSEKMQKLEPPKGGRARTVDMSPGARAVIEAWLELCERNGRDTEGEALVFPHPRTGGYLPAANLTKRLYSAMTKAGISELGEHGRKRNFHSFRHTFARVALETGKGADRLGEPAAWPLDDRAHGRHVRASGEGRREEASAGVGGRLQRLTARSRERPNENRTSVEAQWRPQA